MRQAVSVGDIALRGADETQGRIPDAQQDLQYPEGRSLEDLRTTRNDLARVDALVAELSGQTVKTGA